MFGWKLIKNRIATRPPNGLVMCNGGVLVTSTPRGTNENPDQEFHDGLELSRGSLACVCVCLSGGVCVDECVCG